MAPARQYERKHGAAGLGIDLDRAVHQLGKLLCDREPEAAARGARAAEAEEPFEQLVALFARDSGASILDLEHRSVTTAPSAHFDCSLGRRVQERVLDQDPAELERYRASASSQPDAGGETPADPIAPVRKEP